MTGLRLHKLLPALHFIRHLGKRVYRDDITVLAGHLAYVSLLSLVPLVTVIFALFAALYVINMWWLATTAWSGVSQIAAIRP